MKERIASLREFLFDGHHHGYRRHIEDIGLDHLSADLSEKNVSYQMRAALRLQIMLEHEQPVILPGERIVATRTITSVPSIYTEEEWNTIQDSFYLHEKGDLCNVSPDYSNTLRMGLGAMLAQVKQRMQDDALTDNQKEFLESEVVCLATIQKFISRYSDFAKENGKKEIADTLDAITTDAPSTLLQALQLLRIVHFCLWEAGHYHNTLGRFDQYIYPYYIKDVREGRINDEEAFDLIEEFFLTCNKDSDLYPGMQQGDNGQSLVLGGRGVDGKYLFNEVSHMCIKASYELGLIDPKINIRVDSNTPEDIFTEGSRLTLKGLGFPQYSNDDIVIPGLMRLGYSEEDARNYVMAACWEFIIPGKGMDIPNIDAIPLAECVKVCMDHLEECPTYKDFFNLVIKEISKRADAICEKHNNLYIVPAPMLSLVMADTVDRAQDISLGGKYNNYGFHGTGIATAVDSLAAIKKIYYEEKSIDAQTYRDALSKDFAGYEDLCEKLRTGTPKMGQDNEEVDDIAAALLDAFDQVLQGRVNERGGTYRAGTGTAMFYIFHANNLGATADGRHASEMLPANYSPTLFVRQQGPISVIKSFSHPHLQHAINGGPLTLEFDTNTFRTEESIEKLGALVHTFIRLGGHQLQLNTVNLETLLDAKAHPEKHRNLIVRVWGWSGYFVELDECYQDHVINRIKFQMQ